MKLFLPLLYGCLLSASNAFSQFGPSNVLYAGDHEPTVIITTDIDLDGDLDVIYGGVYGVVMNENLGDGTFAFGAGIAEIWEVSDVEAADFDNDGDEDIIIANPTATGYLENMGDGTFVETDITELNLTTLFEMVDFDGDGDIDIVAVQDNQLIWFEGDGTGAIIDDHIIELDVTEAIDMIVVDVDSDSDFDILWSSNSGGGNVFYIENLGGGLYEDPLTIETGLNAPNSVRIGDLDGDGDNDIIYSATSLDDLGEIYWNENLGGGVFGASIMILGDLDGVSSLAVGDVDLDGDIDLLSTAWNAHMLVWLENMGDASFEVPSIITNSLFSSNSVILSDLDADGDMDAIAAGHAQVFWFENGMLNPQHVEGVLYYDENENGVRDMDEIGLPWAVVKSDPDGTIAVTNLDGTYSIGFAGLADGLYEIYPELEHWTVTSPYDTYDVDVDDDLEFMDSLDFGMFPTEGIDSIGTDISGTSQLRCNAIRPIWISVNNLGTTFPSGIMHLELDDSLTFEWAGIVPDSVVGQNLYWSYEDFFFFEYETFMVHVGTPDGVDDTVTSILTSTIIFDDETIFTIADEITQPIVCAYDPNDKTPDPLGEGPEGNISPSTEWIEYTIRFQNTGTDYAEDVIIKDQLDEDLIWTSIQPLYSSHDMEFQYDPSGEVSFVFDNIMLPDSNASETESHGFVKYRIKLKPGLTLGTTIENTAHIYFDYNPAVITNTTLNTLADVGNSTIVEMSDNSTVLVYPNPAGDFTSVFIDDETGAEYTVRLFNTVGQVVYVQEHLTGGQTTIRTDQLNKGLYVIMIEATIDGSKRYTTKLIVE